MMRLLILTKVLTRLPRYVGLSVPLLLTFNESRFSHLMTQMGLDAIKPVGGFSTE